MLNDEFVNGLTGLVPAHLPQSHSLQYAHAPSTVAVLSFGRSNFLKTNVSQGSLATHIRFTGICSERFYCAFPDECNSERDIKKLSVFSADVNNRLLSFLTHAV